jgi:hypothetical protein
LVVVEQLLQTLSTHEVLGTWNETFNNGSSNQLATV